LEDLEFESTPLFVIRTDHIAPDFDFLFCNETFRKLGLRTAILATDKAALLFRSWAQALGEFSPQYDFDGRTWSGKVAGKSGCWKIVRATHSETEEQDQTTIEEENDHENGVDIGRTPILTRSRTELIGELKRERVVLLGDIPRTNLDARWESIQTMMEMSDVGVFEYNPEGKLLHGNEAWYRLSSHPRNLPSHVEYSFMDLVYPEDQ
jgi:PAS domain-containing protein